MITSKAIVALLVSGLSGLLGSLGQRLLPVEGIVAQAFVDCCGLRVETGAVALRWPLGLDAADLTVKDGKGRKVLTARKLALTANAGDLLRAPRTVDTLTLTGAHLYLRRDKNGRWDLADLMQVSGGATPAPGLRRLELNDVHLHVQDNTQHPPLKLEEHFQNAWLDLATAPGKVVLRADSRAGKRRLVLSAVLHPEGWRASKALLRVNAYPVVEVVKLAPLGWLSPVPQWAAPHGGTFGGRLSTRAGAFQGDLHWHQVHRGRSLPLDGRARFTVDDRSITVQRLTATAGQGRADLRLSCERTTGKGGQLPCTQGQGSLTLTGLDLSSVTAFVPYTFSQGLEGLLTGQVSGSGSLTGLSTLTGEATLVLTQGRLMGLREDGAPLPVRTVRAQMALENQTVHMDRLFLDAEDLGLDLRGRVGLDGALALWGKARLPRRDVLRGLKVVAGPLVKDKKDQVEFQVNVSGTVRAPVVDAPAASNLAHGVEDNVKDVGNAAEKAVRQTGNLFERGTRGTVNVIEGALKRIF